MSFLVILLISAFSLITAKQNDTDVSIDCLYSNVYHTYFEYEWTCTLRSVPDVTQPNVVFNSVTTVLPKGRDYDDVKVFFANARVVRYIPKNLDLLFPSIFGFRFENTQLSYISKDDLKPYPKLRLFTSVLNRIEFLEEDLFVNNPKLEFVSFRSNQIKYIHPNVFEGIKNNLEHLWLDGTAISCGLRGATTNVNVNVQLVNLKKSQCVNLDNAPAFYIIKKQIVGTCPNDDNEDEDVCKPKTDAKEAECNELISTAQQECRGVLSCCLSDTNRDACPTSKVQEFIDNFLVGKSG
jgi:hypothetical protein